MRKQGSLFKRGGVWQFRRVVNCKRRTVSLGVTGKPEAQKLRAGILRRDADTAIVPGVILAGQAWGVFARSLCRSQCSPTTLVGYEAQWSRFAGQLTDSFDLGGLTRDTVSAYLHDLKKEVGPNTWNKHLGCLKYVWRTIQIETGATLPDVFLGMRAMPVPLVRHEAFTLSQVRTLYAAADGEMQGIIAVAAHTGLRRADCLLLDRSAFASEDGLMRVIPRKTARLGAEAVLYPSPLLDAVLGPKLGLLGGVSRLFPESASVYEACSQTWGARFQRFMIQALGLNGDRGLYGFHSFRHFFRSVLAEAGVPGPVIDCMACHGQGAIGARYTHPSIDVLRAASEKLPELR